MRVISFDVGIKNMAYCIFDVKTQERVEGEPPLTILDWNIMNLMDHENQENFKCNCLLENKKENSKKKKENIEKKNQENQEKKIEKKCEKIAKYKKGEQFFCEKHAKKSRFMIPQKKECSPTLLKKKKLEDLIKICISHLIVENESKIPISQLLKKDVLDCLFVFFNKNSLENILQEKKKTANETDLITIGRNMNEILNKNPFLENISHVLIENQISPIANRMKTIQGMLCQYFIMKGSQRIEFISSINKLKGFVLEKKKENEENNEKEKIEENKKEKKEKEKIEENKKEKKEKEKYKEHKKDGIFICSQFLEKNPILNSWKSCLTSSKKDDYADSFLQGIWYLKHHTIIKYNEEYVLQ
jgi:hypothetical protein